MQRNKFSGGAVKELRITAKGLAYLAAMNVHLVPKINGVYDADLFNKFWEELHSVGFFDYLQRVGPGKPLSSSTTEERKDGFY